MRYDEALVDAGLALSNCPERSEAYFIVSDCLIATQKLSEAMKLLEVINKREPNSQIIKSQYDMLRPLFQRQQVTLNDLNVRYCSLSGDLDPEALERQSSKKESASAPLCLESSFNCLSKETNQAFVQYYGQNMSTFNKTQHSIRRKAKLLNTPENYFKLKKFIEDDSK